MQEYDLMGKSPKFLLLNPIRVRALYKADNLIGVQKVRISIRARRNDFLHLKAGYMTEALFLIKNLLTRTAGPYMTRMVLLIGPNSDLTNMYLFLLSFKSLQDHTMKPD